MAVLAGQDHRPARGADGVGYRTAGEAHPLSRQLIQVWSVVPGETAAIGTDGVGGVIVGEDKQDIGSGRFHFPLLGAASTTGQQQDPYSKDPNHRPHRTPPIKTANTPFVIIRDRSPTSTPQHVWQQGPGRNNRHSVTATSPPASGPAK